MSPTNPPISTYTRNTRRAVQALLFIIQLRQCDGTINVASIDKMNNALTKTFAKAAALPSPHSPPTKLNGSNAASKYSGKWGHLNVAAIIAKAGTIANKLHSEFSIASIYGSTRREARS